MGCFRFLLAFCVLLGHCPSSVHNLAGFNWLQATTAVEVFFVISGFYMQMVLREKYTFAKLGGGYRRKFYLARYFRLLPIYLVCLMLTVVASLIVSHYTRNAWLVSNWATIADLNHSIRNILLQSSVIILNITMFFQDLSLISAVRNGEVVFTWSRHISEVYLGSALAIPQAWSLSVELIFYVVAPFILTLSFQRFILLFAFCLS